MPETEEVKATQTTAQIKSSNKKIKLGWIPEDAFKVCKAEGDFNIELN